MSALQSRSGFAQGTFSFAEEFPDYRFLDKTPRGGPPRTCNNVFDAFLAHCEARHAKHDMAAITVACYRRVIEDFWRPRIGTARFLDVRYSTLVALADSPEWSKKTYNNAISVLRRAFKFAYRDYPGQPNPTLSLVGARIKRKDRATVDPFTIQEAETLISAIHRDWAKRRATTMSFGSSPGCDRRNRSHWCSMISTPCAVRYASIRPVLPESIEVPRRPARTGASCSVREHWKSWSASSRCVRDSKALATSITGNSSSKEAASRSVAFSIPTFAGVALLIACSCATASRTARGTRPSAGT
jgi:hypothetical protein